GSCGAYPAGRRLATPVAETATLPYGARFQGGNSVRTAMRAHHLPTGVYPAAETENAVRVLAAVYPEVEPVEDALSAALLNSNGALHAPLVLMNAGPIETLGAYDIHVEGTTPGVRRVMAALDAERIALRRALGYTSADWPLSDYYDDADWFYGPGAFSTVQRKSVWREPLGFEHRYLVEDVGFGLVLWVFGAHEAIEAALLHLGRNAAAVVLDEHLGVAVVRGRDPDPGLAAAVVESVVDQGVQDPGHVLGIGLHG